MNATSCNTCHNQTHTNAEQCRCSCVLTPPWTSAIMSSERLHSHRAFKKCSDMHWTARKRIHLSDSSLIYLPHEHERPDDVTKHKGSPEDPGCSYHLLMRFKDFTMPHWLVKTGNNTFIYNLLQTEGFKPCKARTINQQCEPLL